MNDLNNPTLKKTYRKKQYLKSLHIKLLPAVSRPFTQQNRVTLFVSHFHPYC